IKVVISFVVIALIAVAILLSLRAIKKRTKKA
ncbi:TVP38/TMEM64 family protein, partial [Lactobacillus crispatus]